jgi:integral membrane sensor domain MASE1
MAEHGSSYTPGEMDIHEQVSTFNFVMGMTKWGSLTLASLLLFFVLWFCTGTGFLGALITGVVVAAIGILLLREKKGAGH